MAKRKNIGKSEINIFIELDQKIWEASQKTSFSTLSKKLDIKGFRKGKVPLNIAKKHINQQQIFQNAIDANVKQMATEASKEITKEDKVVAGPFFKIVEITNTKLMAIFSYVLYPDIKLNKYKNLDVPFADPKVTDDDLNKELKNIQDRLSIWNIVKEPIKKGLKVKFDFKGMINKKPFVGGTSENYELIIGSGRFIPGFEEGMLGLKINDTKNINVVFPEKYHDAKMAGKKATFAVKIHEIYKKSVPLLNDALAADANIPSVKTLSELKVFIKKSLGEMALINKKNSFKSQAFALIKKDVDIVIPDVLINQEVQRMVKQLEDDLKKQNMSVNDYIKTNNINQAQLIQQFQVDAKIRLIETFIFAEIAGREKITVTEEDYQLQYEKIAKIYSQDIEIIKQSLPKTQLQVQMMNDKVINLLIKNRKK